MTVRPLLGLTNETADALEKYIKKQDYAYMCLEKTDDARHAHIQVWFNEPRPRGDVCKALQRICERTIEDFNSCQLKVLRNGVRIAYSDWYLDYLEENESKIGDEKGVEIYSHVPDRSLEYYPTEEEQEKTKELANSADPRFTKLEQQFWEWIPYNGAEITHRTVADFLTDMMFNTRKIPVKVNKRDRVALAETLYLYVSKSTNGNACLKEKDCMVMPPAWYENVETPEENLIILK